MRKAEKFLLAALFPVVLFFAFNMRKGDRLHTLIFSDTEGYYSYLPGAFIYGSFKLGDGTDYMFITSCCHVSPDGYLQSKYPYGVSVLEFPFFMVSHGLASLLGGPGSGPPAKMDFWQREKPRTVYTRQWNPVRGYANGFSLYYATGVMASSVFYLLLGLWFLKEFLLRYVSFFTAWVTALTLLFCTNVFYYSTAAAGMSHIYSFFLFSFLLWQTPRFYEKPSAGRTLLLGFTFGLIIFCRQVNIVGFLIVAGFELYSFAEVKTRVNWLWQHKFHLLMIAGCVLVVSIPQFWYYKSEYGTFFPDTYHDEGFHNWNHPPIGKVLFSHQNGFFAYAPVMLLMIPGLWLSARKRMANWPLVIFMFALVTYICASWWAWWFGAAYGHRCFVDFLPLFCLPLALFFQWVFDKARKPAQVALWVFLVFFAHANIKMSYLHFRSSEPWDGPEWTSAKYFHQWEKVVSPFDYWP